ncbi:MAG: response regulator [Deltaproteobacteria bacterium]|nr:response regulator [Deltaproteobacteria bacterium]MBW1794962.1 response regulator [Deltaproteobacteria bacterium]
MEALKSGLPGKILIVDDNQDSRELVAKVLKTRGYQTIEAVDGEEALEKAVAERPDLILMDRSLPKIDGYEVTRRLKSQQEFKDIPIVALTAHAMRGDREKALEAGCEGYISKPINVRELPELVTSYLRGKKESILGGEEE